MGQSVEFRQIWSLEISNKPNQSEPEEPKVRFVAGIHGNAPVGTELLLALAEFLCMNYKKNAAVTKVRGHPGAFQRDHGERLVWLTLAHGLQ